jgi:hypothetical protein
MAEDISEIFQARRVKSKFDKTQNDFIPQGVLEDVVTEASIVEAMEEPPRPLVEFVVKHAPKSFAIMVFAFADSRPEWLRDALQLFHDCGFNDSCLPAEDPADADPGVTNTTLATGTMRKSFEDVQTLDQSRNKSSKICWRPRKITQFCENQWKFLAPVFSTRKHNYDIASMAILPFISKYFESGQGSFGRVYKYEIHPDHIVDPLRLVSPLVYYALAAWHLTNIHVGKTLFKCLCCQRDPT